MHYSWKERLIYAIAFPFALAAVAVIGGWLLDNGPWMNPQ